MLTECAPFGTCQWCVPGIVGEDAVEHACRAGKRGRSKITCRRRTCRRRKWRRRRRRVSGSGGDV
jgi:hypothetical protein